MRRNFTENLRCRERNLCEEIFSATSLPRGREEERRKLKLEPTTGLEPVTCRLRIGCSTN